MRWAVCLGLVACAACGFRPSDLSDAHGGSGSGAGVPSCTGFACQVNTSCPGGGHTSITGTVFAPNGTLPLYNAVVSVPTVALDPFPPGVSCDRCTSAISGSPSVTAITGPDGKFTLVDVPGGHDIPLVVQLGRWRRQVTLPAVADCTNTPATARSTAPTRPATTRRAAPAARASPAARWRPTARTGSTTTATA